MLVVRSIEVFHSSLKLGNDLQGDPTSEFNCDLADFMGKQTIYRVTIQVDSNLLLTPTQRLVFSA